MPFSPDYSDFVRLKRLQSTLTTSRSLDPRKTRASYAYGGYTPSYGITSLPPNFLPGRQYSNPPTPAPEFTDGDFVFSDEALTNLIGYKGDVATVTSLTIPSTTETIASGVFAGCVALVSLSLPNGLLIIEDRAFRTCPALNSLSIPNSVTTIGDSAFTGCSSLTSLTIPNSVTTIGDGAFSGCSGILSLTIPNSVPTIGNSAFYSCSSLTSLTIPDSVTSIGDFAFHGCGSLTSLTIGSGITDSTQLGDESFRLPDTHSLTFNNLTTSFNLTSAESDRIFGADLSYTLLNFAANYGVNISSISWDSKSTINFKFANVDYSSITNPNTISVGKTGYSFSGSTLTVISPSGYSTLEFGYDSNSCGFKISDTDLPSISEWYVTLTLPEPVTSLDGIEFSSF